MKQKSILRLFPSFQIPLTIDNWIDIVYFHMQLQLKQYMYDTKVFGLEKKE